ncbi:MAG TPA: histidine kinase dimerization/phosphoacceptor domain -containing protein [Balneolaceae bacterium]|nr:histidine kinase dimerization/phosphoacceptor domain -containing protein [Balneolaceae bacterium]
MKIRTKLILSFSVAVLLVGGIGIASSYLNETVKDQTNSESKQAIQEIEHAGEMGLQLYRSLTKTQYLLEDKYRRSLSMNFSRGSMSNDVVVKNIDEALKNFRQRLDETEKLVRKDHPDIARKSSNAQVVDSLLKKLDKKFTIYQSLIEQLQKLSSESYKDGKEFFTVTIEPYFRTSLLPLIEEVRQKIQLNHERRIADLNDQLAKVSRILVVAVILILISIVSITFYLYRSIANPIQKLAYAAQSIGEGNLDNRIDYDSNDELGQLSQTFNHMAESLSRTTVSRDYVDSIIESMADLLIVTDIEHNITRVNSAGLSMLHRSEKDLLGKDVRSVFEISGEDSNDTINSESTSIKSQNTELITDDNGKIPVSVSQGTLQGRNGELEGYVIVASDISPEKEAQQKIAQSLKEKEVLLAEIHHRVKNNLAVISGLLQMQIWESENESAISALQQSQLRVRSIALVHEKLYQSESLTYIDFDKYIRDLLDAVSNTYLREDSKISVITDLENVILNINQAIPCSLLVNELVVNSFKHAFDEDSEGEINVVMKKQEGQQVMLQVRDTGKGFPEEDAEAESLGMSLIDTLSQQIGGDLVFKNEDGAKVTITFDTEGI